MHLKKKIVEILSQEEVERLIRDLQWEKWENKNHIYLK